MKKFFIFSLALLSSIIIGNENHKYYKLSSKYLKYLDGVTNRLDGGSIAEMIQVRKMIQDLKKDGCLNTKTNERIDYMGKQSSTEFLAKHEVQLKKQLNNETDSAKIESINSELKSLASCLKQAKTSFIKSTVSFMRRIEGTKKIVINIMEESCKIRNINKEDTVMFEWANTESGAEEAVFNEKIRSFKEFDRFLDHVFGFLGDLLKSCPKGFKQYQQKQKR